MIDARPYQVVLQRLYEDGATDQRIADRIGYSRTAVKLIRTGVTRYLHPDTAQAIADLLGVTHAS